MGGASRRRPLVYHSTQGAQQCGFSREGVYQGWEDEAFSPMMPGRPNSFTTPPEMGDGHIAPLKALLARHGEVLHDPCRGANHRIPEIEELHVSLLSLVCRRQRGGPGRGPRQRILCICC